MMNNPVEVALGLDNLPIGTELVAVAVTADGIGYGLHMTHSLSPLNNRYWAVKGGPDESLTAVQLTHRFDDFVLTLIPPLAVK